MLSRYVVFAAAQAAQKIDADERKLLDAFAAAQAAQKKASQP
tara:strand:- start:1158 stop:1283 length:126 start_codon:yes stop_codon:yes gene_type:complete